MNNSLFVLCVMYLKFSSFCDFINAIEIILFTIRKSLNDLFLISWTNRTFFNLI